MDPLDFLESEELLRFFHCKKTELSCMENPHTFLSQLRDHNLILDDRYKMVSRMKSKEKIKEAIYEILDKFEREQSQQIRVFWKCVFQEVIMNQYPTLRLLHKDVMDGSFHFNTQLAETVEKKRTDEKKRKMLSEDSDGEENSGNKKRKHRSRSNSDEEQPGPSFQLTPDEEETEIQTEQQQDADHDSSIMVFKVICEDIRFESGTETSWMNDMEFVKEASYQKDASWKKDIKSEEQPLSVLIETDEKKRKELSKDGKFKDNSGGKKKKKKTEQRSRSVCADDEEQPGPSSLLIPSQRKSKKMCFSSPLKKGEKDSASAIFKSQLPVTCGDLKATLDKDRMTEGEKCILFENQWFTPGEFEKRAGKESFKNWKLSIRYNGTTLVKLIQEGHLKPGKFKGGCKKTKKSLFPSDQTIPEEKEGNEKQTEQQQEADNDRSKMVFKVTCGAVAGTLHKKRFAAILSPGKLHAEVSLDKTLKPHSSADTGTCGKSIRTETSWMSPVEFVKEASGQTDVSWKRDIKCEGKPLSVLIEENEKNDDECCVCKREGADLVVCDHCTRSFHQKCHLPHVGDDILRDNKPWMCTFCICRNVQEWRYGDEVEKEAAMSQQISQHVLECQYLLLYLYRADEEQMFASKPNNCSKNYSTVVQTPMWFGKIAKKLQKKKYHMVREFVSDVQLIFTNCATYNRDDAEFLARSSRLKKLFDGELKKVFNISEQTVD